MTELGVDPQAWHDRSYKTLAYALQELRQYQQLLLAARPQALLEWTYTWDFGFIFTGADGQLVRTPRYWFLRQFTNLTPCPAEALATASSHRKVLFTAFRQENGDGLTLHMANLGAGRAARLEGLPKDLTVLQAFQTSRGQPSQELPAVEVRDGRIELKLAPLSLLTLTTRSARLSGSIPAASATTAPTTDIVPAPSEPAATRPAATSSAPAAGLSSIACEPDRVSYLMNVSLQATSFSIAGRCRSNAPPVTAACSTLEIFPLYVSHHSIR